MPNNPIVGIYTLPADAENTISQLSSHGFPANQIYVIAMTLETDQTPTKSGKTDDIKVWFEHHFGRLIGQNQLFKYNQHFLDGKYLLVASGTEQEIARAWSIIRYTGYVEINRHEEDELKD